MSIENPLVTTNSKRQKFASSMRDKLKELCTYMNRKLDDDEHHHKKAQGNKHLKTKEYTYEDLRLMHAEGILRTQKIWRDEGLR